MLAAGAPPGHGNVTHILAKFRLVSSRIEDTRSAADDPDLRHCAQSHSLTLDMGELWEDKGCDRGIRVRKSTCVLVHS